MVGRIAMLVAAVCCTATVNAATVNSAAAEQSATEAEYLASIAHLREQSIKEGMIYGDTLLRFDKIDAYVEHFSGMGLNATELYERFSKHDQPTAGVLLYNLDVLVGEIVNSEQIVALFIGKQKAEGTYVPPAEKHLRLYHDFVVDHHGVQTDTASDELDRILGDMVAVAPHVQQIKEERLIPPYELEQTDPEYWQCFRWLPAGYEWNDETGECERHIPVDGGSEEGTDLSTRELAPVKASARIFVEDCLGEDGYDVDVIVRVCAPPV